MFSHHLISSAPCVCQYNSTWPEHLHHFLSVLIKYQSCSRTDENWHIFNFLFAEFVLYLDRNLVCRFHSLRTIFSLFFSSSKTQLFLLCSMGENFQISVQTTLWDRVLTLDADTTEDQRRFGDLMGKGKLRGQKQAGVKLENQQTIHENHIKKITHKKRGRLNTTDSQRKKGT